jgi:hypothetical protein
MEKAYFDKRTSMPGSAEIIVFHNVLGGVAPATAAAPLAIPVENRFIMDLWY